MSLVCALILSAVCTTVFAQSESPVEAEFSSDRFAGEAIHREIAVDFDSGIIRGDLDGSIQSSRALQVPVWSQVVEIRDADWVRLRFADVVLAKSTDLARESYIRVSSLEDGYEQYLDVESLQEWGDTSAYFNGSAVLVELMVSPGLVGVGNRVRVVGVQASAPAPAPGQSRSICFTVDDRVLSDDPRDGRLMPSLCSAWLIGTQGSCFLSAAHCFPVGGDVIEFHVPLSSVSGRVRHPSPQDQYVVDGESVQNADPVFLGNDWAFFGVFDNSTTGLSPLDAQGQSHTLATEPPPVDGRSIRITGYGRTASPVSPTWNYVQKTHVGPLVSIEDDQIRYQTDTTGGNSGSVVLDVATGLAIGIHTNAGCSSSGGGNYGTSLFNAGLQSALVNPIGICAPRTIQASLFVEPTHINPDGGDGVVLLIDDLHDQEVDGTPVMYVDSGAGFLGIAMDESDEDSYAGVFPAIECGQRVSYYFEITDLEGTVVTVPKSGASGAFSTISLDGLVIASEDDFEVDLGWNQIQPLGSGGRWSRVVPSGFGVGSPEADADGSGRCYVTGSAVNQDVDGEGLELISPLIDVSSVDEPVLELAAWMFGQEDADSMTIYLSDTFGISWVEVDRITNTVGWQRLGYLISDYISADGLVRAKVVVSDAGADTVVEAGIDAFRIMQEICERDCVADMNDDGVLNFFDVAAFLDAFGAQKSIADLTGDGVFNFFDVAEFLDAYAQGCP